MHVLRASNHVFSFDLLGMVVERTLPSRDMMIINALPLLLIRLGTTSASLLWTAVEVLASVLASQRL
jgi:hypothetical protein